MIKSNISKAHICLAATIVIFLGAFLLYPVLNLMGKAFIDSSGFSVLPFVQLLSSETYLDVAARSLNIAFTVMILVAIIAIPLSFLMVRTEFYGKRLCSLLLLAPLILPPFIGALATRQIFGRMGILNLILTKIGLLTTPIDWLGRWSTAGIVIVQTLHLYPLMYLGVSAALSKVDASLEEAASSAGLNRASRFRYITWPLILPSIFASAVLVFVGSFTDLGTPLFFEYRKVVAVQLFYMMNDTSENLAAYSMILFVTLICATLFFLSRSIVADQNIASSVRGVKPIAPIRLSHRNSIFALLSLSFLIIPACAPHLVVILFAFSKNWFFTILPSDFTLQHFATALSHPLTLSSALNSVFLSISSSCLDVIIGFILAFLIVRGRLPGRTALDVFSVLPLAIPGIVVAFGYLACFAGTFLDNRVNPFPLLIIAYTVRRLPYMVRSIVSGFQQANVTYEEAAQTVGVHPLSIIRRITAPLLSPHIFAGFILCFTYALLEVSDSLILALDESTYPLSKALYILTARPDGPPLASALAVVLMLVMAILFWITVKYAPKGSRSIFFSILLFPFIYCQAFADVPEIVAVTPHWEGIKRELESGFADYSYRHAGKAVSIRWLDIGGTIEITKYLMLRSKSGDKKTGVDVMIGGGAETYQDLARRSLLRSYAPPLSITDGIPESYAGTPLHDPSNLWHASSLSGFGILINKRLVSMFNLKIPTTWVDLTSSESYSLIGCGDPRRSGSAHLIFEQILQTYGWEEGWKILISLARNIRNFSSTSAQNIRDVSIGEFAFGFLPDSYAQEAKKLIGIENIEFVIPEDASVISVEGIGILNDSVNFEYAKLFVDFILSNEGQQLWMYKVGTPGGPKQYDLHKLSFRPKLYMSRDAQFSTNPFQRKISSNYDAQLAGKRWQVFNDIFTVFIIDSQESIRDQDPLFLKNVTFPVSEVEIEELTHIQNWGNSTRRVEELKRWQNLTLKIYDSEKTMEKKWEPRKLLRWLPSLLFFLIFFWLWIKVHYKRSFSRSL